MANIAVIELIDKAHVVGVFTDQVSFKVPFDVPMQGVATKEDLRRMLSNRLAQALGQDTVLKEVSPGEFDLTPPGPPDPPKPTDREVWNALRFRLQAALILSPDNPIRVGFQKQVDDLALPEDF